MVKSILICLDGSEHSTRALDYAVHLARQLDCELTLMEVIEDAGPLPSYYPVPAMDEQTIEWVANQRLEKLLPALADFDRAFHRVVKSGIPATEIIRETDTGKYDLLVIGTRGNNAFTRFLIGSVSDRVVHHAKCPVMVVR